MLGALLSLALALPLTGCPKSPIEPLRPDAGMRADAGDIDPFFDPIARPARPTLSPSAFTSASQCGECHEEHYEHWRTSMHAYAMVDPVYRSLVAVRRSHRPGEDQFCTACHSAIATRGGEIDEEFDFDSLSDIALEGVTCDACHRISEVRRTHDGGHILDPLGPIRGPISDPQQTAAHESSFSDVHRRSDLCGSCHDIHEVSGLPLERPYSEWLTSPSAARGQTCQDCHMPSRSGRLVDNGPERRLHDHEFVGVDIPLIDGFASDEDIARIRAAAQELLRSSARVTLEVPSSIRAGSQLDVVMDVENLIDGHNFPTGSTFIRQAWLEVIVEDAEGNVIYETGTLDANGDLRDQWSELDRYGDDDLIAFHSGFTNSQGTPELFPWRAAEHFSRSLPPGFGRTFTLFVPTEIDTPSPLSVSVRLRFRTHGPHLLRALGLDELNERVVTYDISRVKTEVALTQPQ